MLAHGGNLLHREMTKTKPTEAGAVGIRITTDVNCVKYHTKILHSNYIQVIPASNSDTWAFKKNLFRGHLNFMKP